MIAIHIRNPYHHKGTRTRRKPLCVLGVFVVKKPFQTTRKIGARIDDFLEWFRA
jgi:hypothetical protein